MVELLLVLVIIAVFAGTAISRLGHSAGNRSLEAAAQRVCADLELARSKAIALGVSRTVRFTLSTASYTLDAVADINRPGQTYTVDLSQSPYGVSISGTNLDGSDGVTVTFNGYGQPVLASGGSTTRRLEVRLLSRGRTLYVVVDLSTGRTRVETTATN